MEYQISVDVDAPPDVVWAVMSDGERWHEWTASVTSVRRLDKGPLRIGSRALIRQPRFPPAVWKVTALEPGHSFIWQSGMPLMWVYGEHSVEPLGSRHARDAEADLRGRAGAADGTPDARHHQSLPEHGSERAEAAQRGERARRGSVRLEPAARVVEGVGDGGR